MPMAGKRQPCASERASAAPHSSAPTSPGPAGVRHPLQFFGSSGRGAERRAHQRQQALDVVARRQFRDHTAKDAVQVDLAP